MSGLLLLILSALSMLGALSIDAYLPALPAIGAEFLASPATVQQSLTVYVVGFAIMTLFYGTLSDSFGRRPVILTSLFLYLLSSAGAAFTDSLPMLMVFRFLQGLSAGAGTVVGRAMVADLATGAEAQRAMSFISTVFGLAPAIAPIIGGWMLSAWGWRSIFYFIASFTLLLFIACFWRLPESLAKEQRQEFHPIVILRAYWQVGGHLEFMLRAIAIALTFSGIMLYVAAAPTFVLDILHLEVTQFAWMFIPIIGGMTLGSYLSGRWADTIEPTRLIGAGFTIMLVSASINVLYSAFFTVQIPWAVVPLFTYAFGANLIVPTMTLMGLEMFPGVRGMASSLQTFLFMLLFSLESGVIVPLLYGDPLRLSGGVLVGAVLSVVCWRLAGRLTETK